RMSSSFSNKKNNFGLKRYYYYRCNSTTKKDWKACSVKQVSAERIENYILENLERISIDKDYVENFVFKLNHGLNTAHRVGHELTEVAPLVL
ncbi:zinc ribbon domain-containing protein, partial [Patescibacteria group bacterium]|nr:zinc ribbon domain-containing protein [Patescibacteria group bacterium]